MVPFKSATIVASSGGKLISVPIQSVFFAAFVGNLCWYLFSQHLLMMHLGGRLVFGSFKVSDYCGHIWREVDFGSSSGSKFVLGSFSVSVYCCCISPTGCFYFLHLYLLIHLLNIIDIYVRYLSIGSS